MAGMTGARLALYTFGLFRVRAADPANDGFHALNDPIMATIAEAPGFIARSGYEGEPGPAPWGRQVWPRWYVEKGDGWAPATLSLWQSAEAVAAFAYAGLHGKAVRQGRDWFQEGPWPPYALWWVAPDHRPDWAEAVARHHHLADHGPTPRAFSLTRLYGPEGAPVRLDTGSVAALRTQRPRRAVRTP